MPKSDLFEGIHDAADEVGLGSYGNLSDEDQVKFALAYSNVVLAKAIMAKIESDKYEINF